MPKSIPDSIATGRRALESITGVRILKDALWYDDIKKWALLLEIKIRSSNEDRIPSCTDWYVVTEESYPRGKIKVYPSLQNSIVHTFPHQSINIEKPGRLWRNGALCLDETTKILGKTFSEPYTSADRLSWHIERAKVWLELASQDLLLQSGDPFELPEFSNEQYPLIAYNESPSTFASWSTVKKHYGISTMLKVKRVPEVYVISHFDTLTGERLNTSSWGGFTKTVGHSKLTTMWVRLTCPPFLDPWTVPTKWGQLYEILHEQGIDLDKILLNCYSQLPKRKEHILLVGIPIPSVVGMQSCQYHWQGISFSIDLKKIKNSKRLSKLGITRSIIDEKSTIKWCMAENWHSHEFFNRGSYHPSFNRKKIIQIGAGSLGSTLAGMLVRGGIKDYSIMDYDLFQPGNTVRHTLGMHAIYEEKVVALTQQLNSISPHANVTAINDQLSSESYRLLEGYNCIIECTGSDDALHSLSQMKFLNKKLFISVSLGFRAKRLFLYLSFGNRFCPEAYFKSIGKWLELDRYAYDDYEFPREGIGCWHPLFPARIDDIYLMVSASIRTIESYIKNPPKKDILYVWEQHDENGHLTGVKLVSQEE